MDNPKINASHVTTNDFNTVTVNSSSFSTDDFVDVILIFQSSSDMHKRREFILKGILHIQVFGLLDTLLFI